MLVEDDFAEESMSYFEFNNINIVGISCTVPSNEIKTDDYIDRFKKEEVDNFKKMCGIDSRRITSEKQTASDLGYAACEELIVKKNIERESIGVLIFVSHSQDYRWPATACVLHKRLNLSTDCMALDVGLGCSGVPYGLYVAGAMLQRSDAKRALVVVAENVTKLTNPNDKANVMLFGDGAAAMLLEKNENTKIISGLLKSDGNGYKAIIAPAGGFRNLYASDDEYVWGDGNPRTLYEANLDGVEVFSFATIEAPRIIKELVEKCNLDINDIDCFALHQANEYIIKRIIKRLKIDENKVPLSLKQYGNTSGCSVLMALSQQYGNTNTEAEVNVMMCGYGVGLSWGAVNATINVNDIFPIIETDTEFEEGIINGPTIQ